MENFIQIMEHNYDILLAYNIGIIDELSSQKWLIIHLDNHGYYIKRGHNQSGAQG